jgi:1-aminocyclopropane-1-carboxylate deaminase
MENLYPLIPLQHIDDAITRKHGIRLFVLRLDLNHSEISGNKLYKLKYNLQEAKKQNKKTLLTFGGAFSNHIAATASAGKEYGFKTIGIIRGDKLEKLNPTLQFATDCGMELRCVSREEYKNKNSLAFLNFLNQKFENFYLIPEGGSNELGVMGCKDIANNIPIDFDFICCACGTGTTMAGVTLSLKEKQTTIGFQVLKGEDYIKQEVQNWLKKFNATGQCNWMINEDYHFGGYAKIKPELIEFIDRFKNEHAIPLDYIYTGKMLFGIYDLIEKNFFTKGQTVIAIHTGGLQGNAGFKL